MLRSTQVLGAYNSLLQLMNSDSLEGVLAFMNGSLSGRGWHQVQIAACYASVGLVMAFFMHQKCQCSAAWRGNGKEFGCQGESERVLLSAVAAFLAAATVSVAGMIGFVGLVVPHIARLLVGSDYKVMMPVSVVLGAVVLLAADTVGRTVVPGMEIPVGIVMAVCGGPFFLYLLRKKGKVSGN